MLSAFSDNLVFFYSPTDLHDQNSARRTAACASAASSRPAASKQRGDGRTHRLPVTDGNNAVPVIYMGVLPDLFREGQGVVVEGKLRPTAPSAPPSVLAKHDENYMPHEVVDALKRSGHWQETGTPQPAKRRPMIVELGHFALVLALFLALVQASCRLRARRAACRPDGGRRRAPRWRNSCWWRSPSPR